MKCLFLCLTASLIGTLYSTAQPAVVAAAKMNVVYIGVKNPIEVAACGYAESAVSIAVDAGTLTKTEAGKYDWTVTKPGDATVTVWGLKGGKKERLGATKFRVKYIPDPEATVNNKHGGAISIALLKAQAGIGTIFKDVPFNVRFRVSGYRVLIFHGSTAAFEKNYDGPYFPEELKAQFSALSIGDRILFPAIKATGADNLTRELAPIEFIITE